MLETLPHNVYFIVLGLSGLGWLALILFPRRIWANFWFSGLLVPVLLGILYTIVMASYWFKNPEGKVTGFMTLAGLRGIFDNPGLLLAGFIDLMSFPLIVGAWITRKAAQIRMPYIYLLLCLVVMILLPATGFVLFAALASMGGRLSEIARADA